MPSLSNESDEATEQTNTTGQLTPILDLTPEAGVYWQLKNRVPQGQSEGLPMVADLRDGTDNALPTDTELMLKVERPEHDDDGVAVSIMEPHIAPWNELSNAEQRNVENIDQVKLQLKSGTVRVRDNDTLHVMVNSSVAIDWTNSTLYFAREGVEELPLQ